LWHTPKHIPGSLLGTPIPWERTFLPEKLVMFNLKKVPARFPVETGELGCRFSNKPIDSPKEKGRFKAPRTKLHTLDMYFSLV